MIEWLFPAQCYVCREEGHWWCRDRSGQPLWPICLRCRQPFHPEKPLDRCRKSLPLLALGRYDDKLREVIHRWKYRGFWAVSRDWAGELAAAARASAVAADGLVPVPLHPLRRFGRGFDQTLVLARQISRRSGRPTWSALRRTRLVHSQTSLDDETRRGNVADTMASRQPGRGRRVWLVDDVTTTGATLYEARRALKKGDWEVVGALVIALA